MSVILGVDPGIAISGYAVIAADGHRLRALDYGFLGDRKNRMEGRRLDVIYRGLTGIIKEHCPDYVAVEELFFNKNTSTAVAVGAARGIAVLAAYQGGLPVVHYTPLEVKQAVTGYGRARKEQVQAMVKAILMLPELPRPDDVADAMAVAICHANFSSWASKSGQHNLARGRTASCPGSPPCHQGGTTQDENTPDDPDEKRCRKFPVGASAMNQESEGE